MLNTLILEHTKIRSQIWPSHLRILHHSYLYNLWMKAVCTTFGC